MNPRQMALVSSCRDQRTAGQDKRTSAHMGPAFVAAQGQRLLLMQLLLPDKVSEEETESAQIEKKLRKKRHLRPPLAPIWH